MKKTTPPPATSPARTLLFILPLLVALSLPLQTALAQGGIGASYERRDDEPKEGLGLRLEKMFGATENVINAGLVAHISFFSNTITLRENGSGSGAIFTDTELSTVDFGLAAKVAVNIPLFTPYVMAGLGYENYKIRVNDQFNGVDFPRDERTMMVNGTVGLQLRVLNAIRPFAEIRYSKNFKDYRFEDTFEDLSAAKNRVAVGISLQF